MITGIDLNFLGDIDGVPNRALVRVFTSGGEVHLSHQIEGLLDADIEELKRGGLEAIANMNRFLEELKSRVVEVVDMRDADA